ncbi:MAG: hypothetical protein HN712_09960 [Gemmatimonadetes bacterium]|jgi:hypothetical protein|nr:hypothetical protein [Gemmatimonadota bacterium]
MTEVPIFDWQRLEREFQQATPLPGIVAGQSDWWQRWHQHLAERTTPRWFYTPEEAPEYFRQQWPALTRCWIDAGEKLLVDLVHAGDFRPGRLLNRDIDWGANPTRSMSWAGFHYWSWANPLIRAYGLTRDVRFVDEFSRHQCSFFEQLDSFTPQPWDGATEREDWRDWVVHNDLSAGIKMATFAEALMVFARAETWSPEDARRATLILLRLAERLYGSYKVATGEDLLRTLNFLTSGGAGLGAVAAILPECAWSTDWQALAQRILEVHVSELFYPDGGHRELCTQYHKAGLRDILFFEQVMMAQGRACLLDREPYRSRLLAALRWLTAVLLPNGTTAVLNSAAASNDWLVTCLVGNERLRDPELAWFVQRWSTKEYVPRQKSRPALVSRILGTGKPDNRAMPSHEPRQTSILLRDSGVAVLRDGWEPAANCMVLDFGRPVGGHAYPARGSFSLVLGGALVAQSPGSPHAYTDPDYKGWMHTSRSQNAVLIDAADQEQWRAPGQRQHGEILRWEVGDESALVQGRHAGYRSAFGIICERTAYLQYGRFFLVHDVIDARGAEADHEAQWSIQCAAPMRELDNRVALATGLVRIEPAWPEQVHSIDQTTQGKAVWPSTSDDGTMDTHRRLHQVRWCGSVVAGGRYEFLMLISADVADRRLRSLSVGAEGIDVDVDDGATVRTVRLPASVA